MQFCTFYNGFIGFVGIFILIFARYFKFCSKDGLSFSGEPWLAPWLAVAVRVASVCGLAFRSLVCGPAAGFGFGRRCFGWVGVSGGGRRVVASVAVCVRASLADSRPAAVSGCAGHTGGRDRVLQCRRNLGRVGMYRGNGLALHAPGRNVLLTGYLNL